MRRRLIAAAAIGIAVLFAALIASGAFGEDSREGPVARETANAEMTAEQGTAIAGPHATPAPITPVVSCPDKNLPEPGIFPRDPRFQPPPGFRGSIVNTAVAVASTQTTYEIIAGAPGREEQRWVIAVRPLYADLCAVLAGVVPRIESRHYAVAPGPVALTEIDGDTIVFRTGDGKSGRLNYVTGTFLDVPPEATPAPTALP